MCGIAGIIGLGAQDYIATMTAALAHRGPDDSGAYVDSANAVALGHTRLSIIDIAGGHQPMTKGGLALTFNGEIYNHRDLRRELESLGHRFQTDHSDTEALLVGYKQWGEGVVEKLDGMFAFALYDQMRRRVILARDRFGEKPLFYFRSSAAFVFSSELPSLRRHPEVAAAPLDHRALQKFFAHTFLPGATTPYRGVHKLLAGETLTYELQTRQATTRRYWRFSIDAEQKPPGTIEDWTEEVSTLLRQAVRSRLEGDVPVGVFLSGGVDSSAIAAMVSGERGRGRFSTFSIGFNEASYDETPYASLVAAHVGSTHRSEVCSLDFMLKAAPDILGRLGEPLGDPSLIPTFMLARHTSQYVKVALSGDGGDELFAGYDPFKALGLAMRYNALTPRPVHRALRLIAARLPPRDGNMSLDFKLQRTLRGLSYAPQYWNPVWLAALDPDELARAFGERLTLEELYSEAIEIWDSCRSGSIIDRTLEFYSNLYLTDDILVKSDRASMMNSLEVRAPFLAKDLVDYVRRLPHDVKFRGGVTKWILKRALRGLIPDQIIDRPKKGFGIPTQEWLRAMPPHRWRALPGVRNEPFADWDARHRARRGDHRTALWCRLALDQCGAVT